jgi:hypothetical protein
LALPPDFEDITIMPRTTRVSDGQLDLIFGVTDIAFHRIGQVLQCIILAGGCCLGGGYGSDTAFLAVV